MSLHRYFEFALASTGLEIELCIQREQLEIVTMRLARRGTWAVVTDFGKIVSTLLGAVGQTRVLAHAFGQAAQVDKARDMAFSP